MTDSAFLIFLVHLYFWASFEEGLPSSVLTCPNTNFTTIASYTDGTREGVVQSMPYLTATVVLNFQAEASQDQPINLSTHSAALLN